MKSTATAEQLRNFFLNDPLMAIAISAAIFAMATTPIAFAILGRRDWFKARRGRVMQRPEFSSIVCGMLLVMGIPAIFTALVIKSQSFDKNRYEFDPNRTWSVLEQGRSYRTIEEADKAVKDEMTRLAETRKLMVENVKKLDEAMLALRAVAGTSPAVSKTLPAVLQRLASVHQTINLEGPQQLMDFTAPPAELATAAPVAAAPTTAVAVAPAAAPLTPAPAVPGGEGITKAEIDAEFAKVPAPQQPLAKMLPLTDLPEGWVVGKSGDHYIETFNAENLFEKIDGRAESFVQYDVKGMAYTNYHPAGDDSNEIQLYIFEMGDTLKALGKYGSEKPDEAKTLPLGAAGYSAAGSTLFYSGPYYTQMVSTTDDPKFAAFALELAKRIAATQQPKEAPTAAGPAGAETAKTSSTPEAVFALLPAAEGRSAPKYVSQDVFGYSFLSDVFMADYREGEVTWQGFLRPYKDAKEAQAILEQYMEGAKKDGAEIKTVEAEGADKIIVCSNIGLTDVYFVKGNVVGGANGATDAKPAEAFARDLVKKLPATIPPVGGEK
ncbi:DUF6599 family protein [Singulisphaera sp. PoT]|uniref:DUF6599 family protein n=1 Tax=Singulisphaera sp. PoT TaxID=3411797 RepID=UPI003BF5E8DD